MGRLHEAWFNPLEVGLPMILFEVLARNVQLPPGEYLKQTEFMTRVSEEVKISLSNM